MLLAELVALAKVAIVRDHDTVTAIREAHAVIRSIPSLALNRLYEEASHLGTAASQYI